MHFKYLACILLFIMSITSLGQVANNQIRNRIALPLDAGWYGSSTTKSNVEWDCINKALTNKCLVYHNDQWFTIVPLASGSFYINISNQECKNLFGVQMIVIEGDPCKTDSYKIKKCIPFTDRANFFIRLDSLESGKEYLINIDGYLGDLCSFNIEFSTRSHGLPIEMTKLDDTSISISRQDSVVLLEWDIGDSSALANSKFHIYRRKEMDKSTVVTEVPAVRNAYGIVQSKYSISDTLRQQGEYLYSIYAVSAEQVLLLKKQTLNFEIKTKMPVNRSSKRKLEYYLKRDGNVTIQVLDKIKGEKLFSSTKRSVKGKNTVTLDFAYYLQQDIYAYLIVIENKDHLQEFSITFPSTRTK